ncbi:MAG TPA: radical SAM protein [Myxococcota bacterium]|nr:radical SAM protein [Myxococcota bacterium]
MPPPIIFLDLPAVARWRDASHLELLDFVTGTRLVADGEVAHDLWHCFERGEQSERVRALSLAQPLISALLADQRRQAWSPRASLELGGFDTLFIELTGRCNERCLHCYADSSPEVTTALDRATCETLLDDAVSLRFRRVQLTGGDPLLCSFLPELVDAADPSLTVEIYTNGLALKDELLAKLSRRRPAFAFSFYSHDAAHHDAITRTPGSQARTRAAIARALAAGHAVRVSIIVMRENADDVAATIAMLEAMGVTDVSVAGTHAAGRGDYWDGKVERASSAHLPRPPDNDSDRPRGRLCVTAAGEVTPCIFNRKDVLGRVPGARLVDIVAAPDLDALPTRDDVIMLDALKRSLQCTECQAAAFMLRIGGNG